MVTSFLHLATNLILRISEEGTEIGSEFRSRILTKLKRPIVDAGCKARHHTYSRMSQAKLGEPPSLLPACASSQIQPNILFLIT